MLPSELLIYTVRGGKALPRLYKPDHERLMRAEGVLETIRRHKGRRRGDLDEALAALEGDAPDYRLVRGLAHLALAESRFETEGPVMPELLRRTAFTLAAERGYGEREARAVLAELARTRGVEPEVLREQLYADLPENEILTILPELNAKELLERYNLAQAQGLLYSATGMLIQAHRNTAAEYKKLFQYLKYFGLMYAVEGDLDHGYQISVDGPASLFAQTRRYGVRMAAFLPALLHVTRWELEADLNLHGARVKYTLTSESGLVSHYAKPPEFDSLLESSFAERWNRLETPWRLEREVEIIDLHGMVFLPDFALRQEGRTAYLEIVGFWRADYLERKIRKVLKADLKNLILAVSERLNVGEEKLERVPGPVIFFKGKLEPKAVLGALEKIA